MSEGRKDDQGKARLDLIPVKPLLGLAEVLSHGADKYGQDNWRHVKDARRRYYSAALRHLFAWWDGELIDEESGLPHLDHVLANIVFLREYKKEKDELTWI
jgi:hypothetical protein